MMGVSIEQLWGDYLVKARWFAGKGLILDGIALRPLQWYTAEADVWVRSELIEARLGASTQTYHSLVGYLPAGRAEPDALVGQVDLAGRGLVDVVDAPRSPLAMRTFLAAISRADTASATWLAAPPEADSPTEVFSGEQSNTTVRVGDRVLFKVFRRLWPGPNLEAVMLGGLNDSGITPALIGTISTPDRSYDLGVFTQRIRDARDGWADCVEACRQNRPIADQMNRLGVTLRRLHTCLAEAFGSEWIDSATITRQMLDRLEVGCEQIPELRGIARALAPVLTLPPSSIEIQRVHGDFHLGQALISPAGWTIIDFEGEPGKTGEARAEPDSVWRDVAGLIRSLDYVRSHHPAPEGEPARRWYLAARAGFLNGYHGSSNSATLSAYELDKAIYELIYETRNRPTWAHIPWAAIRELVKSA